MSHFMCHTLGAKKSVFSSHSLLELNSPNSGNLVHTDSSGSRHNR